MKAPHYELRKALRVANGKPALRGGTYQQFDVGIKGFRPRSLIEEPMLDLYVARINSRFSTLAAARYMELRRRVFKPVKLPRYSPPKVHPLFDHLFRQLRIAA